MAGERRRRSFHLLVGATLMVGTSVVGTFLTSTLTGEQGLWATLGWVALAIVVTFLYLRWQLRSQEESPEAIKKRVSELESDLRKQVQARSYGARSRLIANPLRELDLDITPRVGWVRDPRLVEPEPLTSKKLADVIVAAFESSKRRLLIVGEPGSGKTMTAYSLIEYLDETEGDERIPLLVNLSAWEAQDDFETFLIDYLCSSVGYDIPERAVASAFISFDRYSLILDGLDEIPVGLRKHFSERLDEFVRGLQSEIGVVVTCRTQEYEELRADYTTGLGLVQAVEILPLSSEQLDSALAKLAKFGDKDWELLLSERHLTASQRARDVLSNPLFLNLVVAGRLLPHQLLECDREEKLRDLVIDGYLHRTLADQSQYEPQDARRYLTWIARFLNGAEVSPFGLRTSDLTVFDLADLTPPEPPRRYRFFGALIVGLVFGLIFGLILGVAFEALGFGLVVGLGFGLGLALAMVLIFGLPTGRPFKRSAVSSRLILAWPLTGRQLLAFLRRTGKGLAVGLGFGLGFGLVLALGFGLVLALAQDVRLFFLLDFVALGMTFGLVLGLVLALGFGLLETRSVLLASRTPKEARSRSLIAALTWLGSGLVGGLALGLFSTALVGLNFFVALEMVFGLVVGLVLALLNGGWFVLLQKVAHRRLTRVGNLPPRPYDFLEWGIERKIFRRVGGGVRFRHNLIQQHLANVSEDLP